MVAAPIYVPRRGDLVWLTFNPQAGHEQAGRRPAVVLSPNAYNAKVGLALLCPVTSQVKGYPFEVVLPHGLAVSGAILTDQIRNVDWQALRAEFLCALPSAIVSEVLQKIDVLLSE
jgi:mRNA interferase MazF